MSLDHLRFAEFGTCFGTRFWPRGLGVIRLSATQSRRSSGLSGSSVRGGGGGLRLRVLGLVARCGERQEVCWRPLASISGAKPCVPTPRRRSKRRAVVRTRLAGRLGWLVRLRMVPPSLVGVRRSARFAFPRKRRRSRRRRNSTTRLAHSRRYAQTRWRSRSTATRSRASAACPTRGPRESKPSTPSTPTATLRKSTHRSSERRALGAPRLLPTPPGSGRGARRPGRAPPPGGSGRRPAGS
jgi:hypothetical protein